MNAEQKFADFWRVPSHTGRKEHVVLLLIRSMQVILSATLIRWFS